MNKIIVWLNNARYFHNRIMARFLRRRGWVVFYLDEASRHCSGVCWMEEYQRNAN
jgi:hypothetical protein